MNRRNVIRTAQSAGLHASLIAGAALFSLPFLWLLSTASKEDREVFQEQLAWLPELPRHVSVSPYIDEREYPEPQRPVGMDSALWDERRTELLNIVRAVVHRKTAELPALVGETIDHDEILAGIWRTVARRVPDDLWQKSGTEIETFVQRYLTAEDILACHERARKRFALGRIRLYGWSLEREFPFLDTPTSQVWTVETPQAAVLRDSTRSGEPIAEVHYDLSRHKEVRLAAVVPYTMPRTQFKRATVSLVADRTWADVRCALEIAGQRYESPGYARLGYDQWHQWDLQPASEEDRTFKQKTWLRLDPVGQPGTAFNEPGKMKIILSVRKTPWLKAVWNKLANNYLAVFHFVPFWLYTWNSVYLVLLNVIGQLISCSLVAYAFARLRWPGRELCFVLLLSTLMIPPQVTMIPVFLVFSWLGWYNTFLPLWAPSFFGSAFAVFLLRQFMRSIPRDLEDSARIDGCGFFGTYYHIILPLIKPALATIAIFSFMGVWNDFMGPLIYLNDQRLFPLSLGLFALRVFVGVNFGLLLAASVMMTIPVVLLFFFAQRHFIQGITLTGMKG